MRTLRDLIDTLSTMPGDITVSLDGVSGLGFVSWRGSYDEASLVVGGTSLVVATEIETIPGGYSFLNPTQFEHVPPVELAGDLLALARRLAGGVVMLPGYKGGCYSYRESSRLWGDPRGECPGSTVCVHEVAPGFIDLARQGDDQ